MPRSKGQGARKGKDYFQCGMCFHWEARVHPVSGPKCREANILQTLQGFITKDSTEVIKKLQGIRICGHCLTRTQLMGTCVNNVVDLTKTAATEPRIGCPTTTATPMKSPLKSPLKSPGSHSGKKRKATTPMKLRETPLKNAPAKKPTPDPTAATTSVPRKRLSFAKEQQVGHKTDVVQGPSQQSPSTSTARNKTPLSVSVSDTESPVCSGESVVSLPQFSMAGKLLTPRSKKTMTIEHDYTQMTSPDKPIRKEMINYGYYFGARKDSSKFVTVKHQKKLLNACALFSTRTYSELSETVGSIDEIKEEIIRNYHLDIDSRLTLLCLKDASVLYRTGLKKLEEGDLATQIYKEIEDNCPDLLDMLTTCMCGVKPPILKDLKGPILTIYGIIMHCRCQHLSGLQRMMSLVATRRGLNERGLSLLQRMGLSFTNTGRLKLLERCEVQGRKNLQEVLNSGKLVSLVGDNLDMKVKPRIMTSQRQSRDFHFYMSKVVVSRISAKLKSMDKTPAPDSEAERKENFVNSQHEFEKLKYSYEVLISRIMVEHIPACKFMKGLYPDHIPHELSEEMAQKSESFTLGISFHDEKKLEECVSILDETTTQLTDYLQNVYHLTGFPYVPYHGDQLTRVRLEGAKVLRAQSPTALKRFDNIGPFVSTLWHMKQDFLHKSYKLLWDTNAAASRDKMTLRYFAVLWNARNVNGNVKSNYAAHENHLLLAGTHMLLSQAMELHGMKSYNDWPASIPRNIEHLPSALRAYIAQTFIRAQIDHYQYGQISLSAPTVPTYNPPLDQLRKEERVRTYQGMKIKLIAAAPMVEQTDKVLAYGTQLCQCALQIMNLNDIAREGDCERILHAIKFNVPFFYQHSALSKYFVECIDYILKGSLLKSPADQLRIREGSFVNPRGGLGKCYEVDLHMEHSIRHAKELIMGLGANKSEVAIQRVTRAADTVSKAVTAFGEDLHLSKKSIQHTDAVSVKDIENAMKKIAKVRPFRYKAGRTFKYAHAKVADGMFVRLDIVKFQEALSRVATRRIKGQPVIVEVDPEDEEYESTEQGGLPPV